jgi:hypothetical protein
MAQIERIDKKTGAPHCQSTLTCRSPKRRRLGRRIFFLPEDSGQKSDQRDQEEQSARHPHDQATKLLVIDNRINLTKLSTNDDERAWSTHPSRSSVHQD